MGYYHETPQDKLFDPTLYDLLKLLGKCGTTVVCSAGNDATARELYPAAFAPWDNDKGPVLPRTDAIPIVSVGALNPDLMSTALFSNTGHWVRTYEPGAGLLSTMPPFDGGMQAPSRVIAYERDRQSIDPDNYQRGDDKLGGFAIWSGTSFAAPLFAGKIAQHLVGKLPAANVIEPKEDAVARGWDAVETLAKIKPPQ